MSRIPSPSSHDRPVRPKRKVSSASISWPSLQWDVAWERLTRQRWGPAFASSPGVVAWKTYCNMAAALHKMSHRAGYDGGLQEERTKDAHKLRLLLQTWFLAQPPPHSDNFHALREVIVRKGEALTYSLHFPLLRDHFLSWCKALHHKKTPRKQIQQFYTFLLATIMTCDAEANEESERPLLTTPITKLLEYLLATHPSEKVLRELAKDYPHPVLIRALTPTHPHLITAPALKDTGLVCHATKRSTSFTEYPWDKIHLEAYASVLKHLPVQAKGSRLPALFTPRHAAQWSLTPLHALAVQHYVEHPEASYASRLRLYAALHQKALTPLRLSRALAWCFSLKKKTTPSLPMKEIESIYLLLARAESLWSTLDPIILPRRTVSYILANLQPLLLVLDQRAETRGSEVYHQVETWVQRMTALQLEHTLTSLEHTPSPPQNACAEKEGGVPFQRTRRRL